MHLSKLGDVDPRCVHLSEQLQDAKWSERTSFRPGELQPSLSQSMQNSMRERERMYGVARAVSDADCQQKPEPPQLMPFSRVKPQRPGPRGASPFKSTRERGSEEQAWPEDNWTEQDERVPRLFLPEKEDDMPARKDTSHWTGEWSFRGAVDAPVTNQSWQWPARPLAGAADEHVLPCFGSPGCDSPEPTPASVEQSESEDERLGRRLVRKSKLLAPDGGESDQDDSPPVVLTMMPAGGVMAVSKPALLTPLPMTADSSPADLSPAVSDLPSATDFPSAATDAPSPAVTDIPSPEDAKAAEKRTDDKKERRERKEKKEKKEKKRRSSSKEPKERSKDKEKEKEKEK